MPKHLELFVDAIIKIVTRLSRILTPLSFAMRAASNSRRELAASQFCRLMFERTVAGVLAVVSRGVSRVFWLRLLIQLKSPNSTVSAMVDRSSWVLE